MDYIGLSMPAGVSQAKIFAKHKTSQVAELMSNYWLKPQFDPQTSEWISL